MAEQDLIISFSATDLGVIKTIGTIIDGLGKLQQASDAVAKGMKTSFSVMAKEMKNYSQAMKGMANKIQQAVTSNFAKITAAIGVVGFIGTIKKSINMANEFQDAMLRMSAVTGKSMDDLQGYSEVINDLERTTRQGDTELAAGLTRAFALQVKGLDDTRKAREFLLSAEKLSLVGNMDYQQSVEFLASTLKAFNKDASESGKVMGTLYNAAKAGNKTVQQFGAAMQPLAYVANNVGVSFEELAGAFAAVGKNSRDLQLTSMEMRTFLFSLQKPNKELTKLVKSLGKEYNTAADYIKKNGLVNFIEKLKQATKGDVSILGKMFDARTLRSVSALVNRSFDDFKKNVQEIGNSTDKVESLYEKMSKSFSSRMANLKNRWEDILQELGTKLLPYAEKEIGNLVDWLEKNGESIAETFRKIAVVMMEIMKLILPNMGKIIIFLTSVWTVGKFPELLNNLKEGFEWIKKIRDFVMVNPWTIALTAALTLATLIFNRIKSIREQADLMMKYKKEGQMNLTEEEYAEKYTAERAKSYGQEMRIGGKKYRLGPGGPTVVKDEALIEKAKADREALRQKLKFESEEEEKRRKEWEKKHEAALKALHDLKLSLMDEESRIQQEYNEKVTEAEKMAWGKGAKGKEDKAKYLQYLNESFLKKQMDLTEKKNEAEIEAAKKRAEIEEASIKKIAAYRDEQNKEAIDAAKFMYDLRLQGASEEDKKLNAYLDKIDQINSMRGLTEGQKMEAKGIASYQYREETKKESFLSKTGSYLNEVVIGFFRKAGESFYDVIISGLDTITGLIQMPFEKISNVLGAMLQGGTLQEVRQMVIDGVQMFQNMFDNIPQVIDYLARIGIPALLTRFVNVLPTIIEALIKGLPLILDEIISKLDRIIIPFVHGILKLIPELIKRLPALIEKIIEMIPMIIEEIIKAIPDIALALGEAIVNIINDALKFLNPLSSKGFLNPTAKRNLWNPFTWFHSGGMITEQHKNALAQFSNIRAHQGMYLKSGLQSGEVPIIGQVGEAVMNQRFVNNVGGQSTIDKWNRDGNVSSGNVVNNVFVENMMSRDTARVIDTMMNKNLRNGSGNIYQRIKQPIPGFKPQRA